MKSKPDHSSDDKVKLFWVNIVVIEEEWFSDIDLTGGATFPTSPIKRRNPYSIKKFR